ncbi:hypothetical protein JR316_0010060 [Psilocybe cubensis]|uniref:Uncharacterized protein n=1 Tax=Psilocybe cubensis TaxID=181762 RepID=A0ACB8GQ19_PSICU|nr:hypothetical protein JR316_0010060 [Psilocybe cubensis]KAH9477828.1 hypothetical protein JR316_0010060 [Psilocybe cubensis]
MILGEIIALLGESFSRFPAKRYSVIFLTFDILCLFIQGAGGGIAASGDSLSQTKLGTDVILVGIIFQLLVIIAFMGCALEFYHRFQNNKPFPRHDVQRIDKDCLNNRITPGIRWMSLGLMLSIFFFLIRSIYRIIELAGGWDGTIIHTQIYFNLFDGLMITFAIYTINILHPGRLFPNPAAKGYNKETNELDIITP